MTSRKRISEKLVGVSHLLDLDNRQCSYYMNHERLSRAKNLLEEICEDAKSSETIKTNEIRTIERIDQYVKEAIEKENDKNMSDLDDVVEIISCGLAKKIHKPEEFNGYNPGNKKHAEKIGINIRIRGSA